MRLSNVCWIVAELEKHWVWKPWVYKLGECLMRSVSRPDPRRSERDAWDAGSRFLVGWYMRIDQKALDTLALARAEYHAAVDRDDAEACEFAISAAQEAICPPAMLTDSDDFRAYEADLASDADYQRVATEADRMREDFHAKYMAAKEKSGLKTQLDVAEAAEIHRATVIAIEKHKVLPRRETINRLARAFGIGVDELAPCSEAPATIVS